MNIIWVTIKRRSLGFVLATTIVLAVSVIQHIRRVQEEKIFHEITNSTLQGEKFDFDNSNWFKVYIRPLGVLGYYVFDSELFVVESNGRRHLYVCNFYSQYKFLSALAYLTEGGAYARYNSFDELRMDKGLRFLSRWKPLGFLTLLDALFSSLICAIIIETILLARKMIHALCIRLWPCAVSSR